MKYIALISLLLIILYLITIRSNKTKGTIILYYATWCGYCKKFMPVFDEFEEIAKTKFPDLVVQKIMCDKKNPVCSNINGFPTVVLVKNDKISVFKKDRTVDELIKFVN